MLSIAARLRLPLLAVLAFALLNGCGAADLVSLIDVVGAGGSSGNATSDLAGEWTVQSYSGTTVGSVTVSADAKMKWTFGSNATFTVTSAQALSIGSGQTKTYDVAGAWLVTNTKGQTIGLTVLRDGTTTIASANQVQRTGTYTLSGSQLVIQTDAIGPGTVRYILAR